MIVTIPNPFLVYNCPSWAYTSNMMYTYVLYYVLIRFKSVIASSVIVIV